MKSLKESKTELIQIRMTKDEKKKLQEKASRWGMNLSDYIRMVALEEPPGMK